MDQFLARAWPWILSTIFGIGAGVGSARGIAKNQEKRLQAVEDVLSTSAILRPEHTLMCAKIHAETTLQTKIAVDEAVEKMGEKILSKIEHLHINNGKH